MGIVRAYKNPQTGFDTRSGGVSMTRRARRQAGWRALDGRPGMTQPTRVNLAIWLLGIAIAINLVLLFSGDTSPGWPIAAVILLGASAALMLSQRREP
jgi:hypothetical protein